MQHDDPTGVLVNPGVDVEGYFLEAELGRGGMGLVYRARQVALDREVALKVIAPHVAGDPQFVARFRSEFHLAASIDHPNVIPIYDGGVRGGVPFLAMRLVNGTDLRAVLQEKRHLSLDAAIYFVAQLAYGLDAVHRAGLVHRDVKPA